MRTGTSYYWVLPTPSSTTISHPAPQQTHTQLHNNPTPSSMTNPHPASRQYHTQFHDNPTPSSTGTPHPAPQQPHTQLHSNPHTQLHNNPTPSSTATPHPAPQQPHTQLHSNPTPAPLQPSSMTTHAQMFFSVNRPRRRLSCRPRCGGAWTVSTLALTSASKLITCTW